MASLSGVLTSLAGPLAKKALTSLGVGVISYAALSSAVSAVSSAVSSAYGGMTGDVAAIISLAGFGQALGIILGGFTARVTFIQLNRLGVLSK